VSPEFSLPISLFIELITLAGGEGAEAGAIGLLGEAWLRELLGVLAGLSVAFRGWWGCLHDGQEHRK
jgi:hypothetical protein